jgi:NADPH-dependent ferric siderophore reductase
MTLAAHPIPAYRPFLAQVTRAERLSPSFLRVTFTGPSFDDLAPNGWDQRIKVLLPIPDRGLRDCPRGEDWYAGWRALPEAHRNPMRTYTVRAARPERREIDVDFVLHGATGPASAWAVRAAVGDEVVLIGPNAHSTGPTGGFEWRPPPGAPFLLLAGDETAVPAVCAIVEALPPACSARVFLEVPEEGDVLPVMVPDGVAVTWLPRRPTGASRGTLLRDAVVAAAREVADVRPPATASEPADDHAGDVLWDVPADASAAGPYAWLAGEAGVVTGLRRDLVGLGVDRRSVAFMGYWRAGRPGT